MPQQSAAQMTACAGSSHGAKLTFASAAPSKIAAGRRYGEVLRLTLFGERFEGIQRPLASRFVVNDGRWVVNRVEHVLRRRMARFGRQRLELG